MRQTSVSSAPVSLSRATVGFPTAAESLYLSVSSPHPDSAVPRRHPPPLPIPTTHTQTQSHTHKESHTHTDTHTQTVTCTHTHTHPHRPHGSISTLSLPTCSVLCPLTAPASWAVSGMTGPGRRNSVPQRRNLGLTVTKGNWESGAIGV